MNRILSLEEMTGKPSGRAFIEYRRDPEDSQTIPDREYLSDMMWYGNNISIVDCYGAGSTATFDQMGPEEYGITWRCWEEMPTEEERKAGWDD